MNTLKTLTGYWWLTLIKGLVLLFLGFGAIIVPGDTLQLVVLVLGLFLMADGVVDSIMGLFSIRRNKDWWLLIVKGVASFLFGIALFAWPVLSLSVVLLLVGLWAIVAGIMLIVMAIVVRKEGYGEWFLVAGGVVAIIFAVLLFANPQGTVKFLTIAFGVYAIVSGVLTMAFAMEMRAVNKDVKKVMQTSIETEEV